MPAHIIETCAARGAILSGAARRGGGSIGYMPRNVLFYVWLHNFFPKETQLDKGSFCFPGKILSKKDFVLFIVFFFQETYSVVKHFMDRNEN